jgi:hypothetical protein
MLTELLSIIQQTDSLFEDLGNLKIIDPKFLKALRTSSVFKKSKDSRHPYGKSYDILDPNLGKDSKIEKKSFKNPVEAFKSLDGKDAMLLTINDPQLDKQVAIFIAPKYTRNISSASETGTVTVGLDLGYFKELADKAGLSKEYDARIKKDFNTYGSDTITKVMNMPDRKASPLIKLIADMYKKAKMEPEYIVAYTDTNRQAKQADRLKNQKGVIPMQRDKDVYNKFAKEARQALRFRLDKYKSSRAKGVDDPDELIQEIIKSGYLDKFKYGGFTYDLKNDYIRFGELRKGAAARDSEKSYIEYGLSSNSVEYGEMAVARRELRSKLNSVGADSLEGVKIQKQMDGIRPPSTLKVILKMEGGKIVPSEIEIDQGFLW